MATKKDKKTSDIQKKLEEAKQLRLEQAERLKKPITASDKDNKNAFEDFWTQNRKAYGADRELGKILWLHLKAIKHDSPEKFEEGIKNFGINKGDK